MFFPIRRCTKSINECTSRRTERCSDPISQNQQQQNEEQPITVADIHIYIFLFLFSLFSFANEQMMLMAIIRHIY